MFFIQAAATRAPGGIETAIKHYHRMFKAEGVRSVTLYAGPAAAQLRSEDMDIIEVSSRRILEISALLPALSSFRKRLRQEARGEPIAVIVHSDLMLPALQRLVPEAKIVSVCHSDQVKRKSRSDIIIALNTRQYNLCLEQLPNKKDQVHILGNPYVGNQVSAFSGIERSLVSRFVFCARFVELKDPVAVLRAYRLLGVEAPPLTLIGDGPLIGVAKEYARAHQINADFMGWKANPWAEISPQDILVVPSIWEGLPFLIQEALAHHVPVIASDIAGNMAALNNGEFGDVYPVGDDNALARILRQAIINPERLRKMSAAGGMTLNERYGAHAFYKKLQALLAHDEEHRAGRK